LAFSAASMAAKSSWLAIRSARPCTTTGSCGLSVDTVQRAPAPRLRALRDPFALENHSRPVCHTAQTGIRCGAPCGVTVASQKSCERSSLSTAQDQGSSPVPSVAGRVP